MRWRWISTRIGQSVFTTWAVITIAFILVRFMPGGPLDYIRAQLLQRYGSDVSMERINRLVELYANIDPNKSVVGQYISYLLGVLQGDLGTSMWFSSPVSGIIADTLPWTVFLMGTSLLFTFAIGITLGAVMAYNEGTKLDQYVTSIVVWLNGVPYYVAALLLLYILGYQLGYFPIHGRVGSVSPNSPFAYISSVLYHGALPIFSLVITEFGGWAMSMRGNSIQILGKDYLRVARLRGLSSRRIAIRYVGRNAILPMYTSMLIALGFLFGGSVILEQVFAYPGTGFYLVKAVSARDYPLMMGIFLVITLAVVIGIFIADLTYGFIDPRIRHGQSETQ